MRLSLLAASVAFLCLAAAPFPKKASPLEGAWLEYREKGAPGGDAPLTITIKANGKLTFDDGKAPAETGSYKLYGKKDPPWIDWVTPARNNPGNGKPPFLAVYKLEGDTLTLYLNEKKRPTKCEAPEGSGIMVCTLHRKKR